MKKSNQVDIRSKVTAIKWVLLCSFFIMGVKFAAWRYSHSQAILSDALESLINIATSFFTLYSLIYASKLRDSDHPYGHGKIEYLAVGFEGALIFGTGIYIIYNSVIHLIHPEPLEQVDVGLLLTSFSAFAMWFIGRFLKKKGRLLNSLPLQADGAHFNADAITSIGLIIGLAVYNITGWLWVDPALAILLALHIMFSGYKLLREAIDHLLDKADVESIQKITTALQQYRHRSWIDIHNLRLQKFGHYMHVDCHLTLPFYYTLEEVHHEIKLLENELNRDFHNHVELFVHTDPCLPVQCRLCSLKECMFRKEPFIRTVEWTTPVLMENKKHQLVAEE
ncbi:MAG: cation diffusion facilitator family transporter [Bacteroidia bacterium]